MPIQEWELATTNLGRAKEHHYEVAVLPTSAIEPHNHHLPYGEDFLHTGHIARRCCQAAWEKAPAVLCLPGIPYGVDCNLLDYPLAIHVSQATLDAMIRDIIVSLHHHGIRKIVLLNGHGGNDFTPFIRQMQCDLDVHIFVCNWWTVGHDHYHEIFDKPDDHGGIMETSVSMALFPDLVETAQARHGIARPYRFEALRKGWVRTSRNFGKVNDHCAVGDPQGADIEKGRRYLEIVCQRITDFLIELATTPIDSVFPLKDKLQ